MVNHPVPICQDDANASSGIADTVFNLFHEQNVPIADQLRRLMGLLESFGSRLPKGDRLKIEGRIQELKNQIKT